MTLSTGFALYRALLRQTSKLHIPSQRRQQYENLIKSKTRENARLQGHWDITIALRLGYEVQFDVRNPECKLCLLKPLQTLDAVQDEIRRPVILNQITELSVPPLKRFPRAHEKTSFTTRKPKCLPTTTPSPSQHQQPSHNSPVLSRPYPTVSGRRHIPKLVNANRVPILRIKKPQSRLLGALIRSTVRTREKRLLRTSQLEKLTKIGKDEDEWDRILGENFAIVELGGSWTEESVKAHNEIKKLHDAAVEKRKRIAREMTIIVEKEKALAQEERAELRKTTNVQSSIKFLTRHGRVQEAKKQADMDADDFNDLRETKETKVDTTTSKLQGYTNTVSDKSKTISETPTHPTSVGMEEPTKTFDEADMGVKTDATQVEAVQPQQGVRPETHLTVARAQTALDRPRVREVSKPAATRKAQKSAIVRQAGTIQSQHRKPLRIRHMGSKIAINDKAADKKARNVELAKLEAELPVRNLGGMGLAEAMGEVE